jgi:hypothetical protein
LLRFADENSTRRADSCDLRRVSNVLSYGSPDQALIDQARLTFASATYSSLSFTTTPVELLSLDGKDHVKKHASGFFWRHAGIDFVITNWHVVSGRNPFTGELLDSKTGFVPQKIKVHGWAIATPQGKVSLKRTGWTADLGEEGARAFANPPIIDGCVVDIAAIPLPARFPMDRAPDISHTSPFATLEPRLNLFKQDRIASQAGDDCVILGYPLKNYTGLYLPIWKRGALATESNMPVDGLPAFLIDAATSPAMSGSPIFRRAVAGAAFDKQTKIVSEVRGFEFVGVYAGRLMDAELNAINVGYGWLASQVEGAVAHSWKIWKGVADVRASDAEYTNET